MKLSDIVNKVGGTLEGDGSVEISGLESLNAAECGDITFLTDSRYASKVASTKASAILVKTDWSGDAPCPVVRVDNPNKVFAEISSLINPPPIDFGVGVHATAVIAENVKIGKNAYIGPCCVIESGVTIGDNCVLVAGCYIGHECTIGDNFMMMPKASIRERVQIGDRVILHNGSVIGSDGFGYEPDKNGAWQKVQQLGIVVLEDDVEIGANTTIDRARFGKTIIGKGVKLDNLVHIAHNVTIGEHTAVAALTGIAGSTAIGKHAQLAGQTGITGHVTIGDYAITAAQSGVTKDIPPKTYVSGYPAMEHRKAAKSHASVMRLPALKKRVGNLEIELQKLKDSIATAKAGE